MKDELVIGSRRFTSRLMVGTGKYRNADEMNAALAASGTQIVTVAIGRINFEDKATNILDQVDLTRYTILPNTAGARTPEEALRIARLSRELGLPTMIKLEVIPDTKYLLPDPIGTLQAAELMIQDGFEVLPYINDDPMLAKRLQELGTVTVMPLASPIGSGQGMVNFDQIRIIIEQATVPVVVDAGLGVPSDASTAMEIGADACLVNTAIAQAQNPALMGEAFKLGVEAGRKAFLAGRIPKRAIAQASSPLESAVRS